jgi:hypothetical protein
MHRRGLPSRRRAIAKSLFAVALGAAPCAIFAQGTLTTSDGMRLTLGASGSVTSLQSGGVEYSSSAIASGLMYRELPATASNAVPNGSFETGTSTPTSWSWANDSSGSWALDALKKWAGTRSLKVTIPGTTAKRSPTLTSSTFTVKPNAVYTLSVQMSTSGLTNGLSVFLYEKSTGGVLTRRNVTSPTGTTGWQIQTLTFTTRPDAASAYFQAYVYSGYGTAWLDDVQLLDVFGGRVPVAFGGSVASGSGTLTQTASTNGLSLSAKFSSAGTAIRVDATLTDTTGADRPIEVSFRMPLDVPGWKWDQDFLTSAVIADGVRNDNADYSFNPQGRARYPFATVRNASAAFSMAVPMGAQMQRFSYDTLWGFRSAWDFGLSAAATKTKSKASWTFWIFTNDAKWGLRGAAQKLYALDTASFTTPLKLNGAWALGNLAGIPTYTDFGWGFKEGDPLAEMDFCNQHGILVYHYINPVTWFRQYPGLTVQPSYDTIVATLLHDAAAGTGSTVDGISVKEMAQAIVGSSPYDQNQRYQVTGSPYFWYSGDLQAYPGSPDLDIPAPSLGNLLKKYSVDGRIAMWAGEGNHIDGIFLDNLTRVYSALENHRRALWAYSDIPLTFSYQTRKVILYVGFSASEFVRSLRAYLATKGMRVMGSANSIDMTWVSGGMDTVGGEVGGAEPTANAYQRRALAYGKNWTNLQVPSGGAGAPTAAQVLAYFRQALLLGYYPGFNGVYWSTSSAYTRDRALFKQYFPLFRKIIGAGWRPIPYATPSDPAIYVERFDDQAGNTFYLTAQNSSTVGKTVTMTVDGAALGAATGTISLKELVGNTTLSASRSGSNILFTDSLAAGETVLYEMTVTGGTTPPPGPTPTPGPPPTGLPSNGSFESGSGSPTGWTLGTSATNGTWSWDATTASSGTRSAKLAVAGTVDKKSPALRSANFALAANQTRTLSVWTKSSAIAGAEAPTVWIVQTDSAGRVLTTSSGAALLSPVTADVGTGGWVHKTVTFPTDARCAQAYVYANIYGGRGTVWIDNVQIQ